MIAANTPSRRLPQTTAASPLRFGSMSPVRHSAKQWISERMESELRERGNK